MPNVVRNKIFTEFAMESSRDSIKYVKPVFSPTQSGLDLNDKHTDYGTKDDPWGYNNGDDNYNTNNAFDDDYQKALYETGENRGTSELINAPYVTGTGPYVFHFRPMESGTKYLQCVGGSSVTATADSVTKTSCWATGKYLKGYGAIYGDNKKDVIAVEDKRTGAWYISADYSDVISKVEAATDSDGYATVTVTLKSGATAPTVIKAYARCDLEDDFNGNKLGEVTLKMTDYEFRPRPTEIGVTWSQLAEINLDASFGISAQELLVQSAAQFIRVNLDYQAIMIAYQQVKTNPKRYRITFDAAYAGKEKMEGYMHNALTFMSAVDKVSDVMFNEIND